MEKILSDGEILENRLIWIDALKSDGYKQCQGQMYDGTGFCCLGVAKKVLTGQLPYLTEEDLVLSHPHYKEVKNLLDLSQHEFIMLNDFQGKSFSEIADYAIEKWNLQKHFQEPHTSDSEI